MLTTMINTDMRTTPTLTMKKDESSDDLQVLLDHVSSLWMDPRYICPTTSHIDRSRYPMQGIQYLNDYVDL